MLNNMLANLTGVVLRRNATMIFNTLNRQETHLSDLVENALNSWRRSANIIGVVCCMIAIFRINFCKSISEDFSFRGQILNEFCHNNGGTDTILIDICGTDAEPDGFLVAKEHIVA